MSKFSRGVYQPKNIEKYSGKNLPQYRSSWERKVFIYLDESKSVVNWASEPLRIPYKNPLTGKMTNYIPDLLVAYVDKSGKTLVELIEIKPKKETLIEYAKSKRDQMALAVNMSKWEQAALWCKMRGVRFRVMTEDQIFGR